MNIPIYRAKKKNNDEYVVGYYSPDKNYQEHIHTIFYFDTGDFNVDRKTTTQIDISTIAIHFPDMLDSQGNKIFASLSEDGKGGDITELQASSGTCLSCGDKLPKTLAVAIYEQMEFREIELNPHKCFRKRENNYMLIGKLEYKKVIGIQK